MCARALTREWMQTNRCTLCCIAISNFPNWIHTHTILIDEFHRIFHNWFCCTLSGWTIDFLFLSLSNSFVVVVAVIVIDVHCAFAWALFDVYVCSRIVWPMQHSASTKHTYIYKRTVLILKKKKFVGRWTFFISFSIKSLRKNVWANGEKYKQNAGFRVH